MPKPFPQARGVAVLLVEQAPHLVAGATDRPEALHGRARCRHVHVDAVAAAERTSVDLAASRT